jgi:hypothetical protein
MKKVKKCFYCGTVARSEVIYAFCETWFDVSKSEQSFKFLIDSEQIGVFIISVIGFGAIYAFIR